MKRTRWIIILVSVFFVLPAHGLDLGILSGVPSFDTGNSLKRPEEIFLWSANRPYTVAAPGEVLYATFQVEIPENHYIYRDKVSFELVGNKPPLRMLPSQLPVGTDHEDPFTGEKVKIYQGLTQFVIPLQVLPTAGQGGYDFTLAVSSVGCSDKVCFPTVSKEFAFRLAVKGGPVALEPSTSEGSTPIPDSVFSERVLDRPSGPLGTRPGSFSERLGQSLSSSLRRNPFLALPIAFLLGILTSLTPCVYPLIPITVSIFGASQAKTRRRSFALSFTYVLGIVATYSVIGAFVISFGLLFGSLVGSPIVAAGIAAFFVAMGISMLGVFSVALPSGLQGNLVKVAGPGYLRSFAMGLVIGVVAAPCTGPALALILAFAHEPGHGLRGMAAMVAYAFGLGILFLVLGTFAGRLSRLPKSGEWMDTVKAVFAVLLFATALYFLGTGFRTFRHVFEGLAGSSLVVAVLVASSFLLGAYKGSFHDLKRGGRIAKTLGIVAITVAIYLVILSPGVLAGADQGAGIEWITDFDEGFKEAEEKGLPIVLDFTADWCTYCQELDRRTFSDPTVRRRLDRFVRIRVDLSRVSPEENVLTERYGVYGLPAVLFLEPNGTPIPGRRINQFVTPEEFLQYTAGIAQG